MYSWELSLPCKHELRSQRPLDKARIKNTWYWYPRYVSILRFDGSAHDLMPPKQPRLLSLYALPETDRSCNPCTSPHPKNSNLRTGETMKISSKFDTGTKAYIVRYLNVLAKLTEWCCLPLWPPSIFQVTSWAWPWCRLHGHTPCPCCRFLHILWHRLLPSFLC